MEKTTFEVNVQWEKQGEFSHLGFNRDHVARLESGVEVAMAGAHTEGFADPELLLCASLASCHMQTFLAVAAKKRLEVVSYQDHANAHLSQNEEGRFWVSNIELQPSVKFGGNKTPPAEVIEAMHHKAHQHCFIANSLTTQIVVTPKN